MAGALERVNTRFAAARGRAVRRRDSALSLDAWEQMFSFGGLSYPLVQTTQGNLTEEHVAATSAAAYQSSGPVFSLVLARLQVFSQARFQWARFSGGVPGSLFGSPELKLLERPWPGGTTGDLLARMEVDASAAGTSFVRRTTADRVNRLRPDWVTIVLGSYTDAEHPAEAPDVELAGLLYKPPSGRIWAWPARDSQGRPWPDGAVAIYAPIPDPDFAYLGRSWIGSVLREVRADQLATEHKGRFFLNAATPNLAIKFDPSVTLNQVKEFKELLEDEHQGAWNAYKTLYLGGGADATTVGLDFRQMDFAATQGKGETRLASAAGVPPSWAGFSEGLQGSSLNAGNFDAARRRFAHGTMHHLWSNVASSLEPLLGQPTDASGAPIRGASLWYDTRAVPFMQENAADAAAIQAQEAQTITALVRDGFTPASAVDAVQNHDWSRLQHSGLTSVQLLPPGDQAAPFTLPQQPANGNGNRRP
jgi:hypothetical protein